MLGADSSPFCAGLQRYPAKLLFCAKSFKTADSWHKFSLMIARSLPGVLQVVKNKLITMSDTVRPLVWLLCVPSAISKNCLLLPSSIAWWASQLWGPNTSAAVCFTVALSDTVASWICLSGSYFMAAQPWHTYPALVFHFLCALHWIKFFL